MGLVALTENLILLQFEFCIDYDAEDGGKVLLKRNDVETVCLLSKLHEAKHHVNVKLDMDELDLTSAKAKATYKEIEE